MSKVPSSASSDPLMINAIIRQQLCRPAGYLPKTQNGRFDADRALKGLVPELLQRENLSGPEKKAMSIAYMIALGEVKGTPPALSDQQKLYLRWITSFCGGAFSVQMTPLRFLQIHILSKLVTPELKKASEKIQLGGLFQGKKGVELGSLGEIKSLHDLFLAVFNDLQRSFSMLERSLVTAPTDPKDPMYWLDQAKSNIQSCIRSLELGLECLEPKEKQKETIHQVQADLQMLLDSLEDSNKLFPLLLMPMGTYNSNPGNSIESLSAMRKQCFVFAETLDCFVASLKGVKGGAKYQAKLKKLNENDRSTLLKAYAKVIEEISTLCELLKEGALTLEKSATIKQLLAQPTALNQTQIKRMQELFQKCSNEIAAFSNRYFQVHQQLGCAFTKWKTESVKLSKLNEPDLPLITEYPFLFNLTVRYSAQLIGACGKNDVEKRVDYHQAMNKLVDSVVNFLEVDRKSLNSEWASIADLLFLKVYQHIDALSALNPSQDFQSYGNVIYANAVIIHGLLQNAESHLKDNKKDGGLFFSNSLFRLLETFSQGIRGIKIDFPNICRSPHFLALGKIKDQMLQWVHGSVEGDPIEFETLIHCLLLRAGERKEFDPKLFSSIIRATSFCNKILETALREWKERLQLIEVLHVEGSIRVNYFISDLSSKLMQWKKVVDELSNEGAQNINEKQVLQYVEAFLVWQKAVDEIDLSGIEKVWTLLIKETYEFKFPDKEQERLVLKWIEESSFLMKKTVAEFQSSIREINTPLLRWGGPLCLGGDRPTVSPKKVKRQAIKPTEELEEIAPVLSPPPSALKGVVNDPRSSAQLGDTKVVLRSFDQIESAIQAALLELEPTIQVRHMKTMMEILRGEFYSLDAQSVPFSHAQLLYFHTAMYVEQSLKYLISQREDLSPQRVAELQSSHGISELLQELEIPLSADQVANLTTLENFYLGGRYLNAIYGREAAILRSLAQGVESEEAEILLTKVEEKVIGILRTIHEIMSKKPIPLLEEQKPLKLEAAPMRGEMIPLIEEGSRLGVQIAAMRRNIDHHQRMFAPIYMGQTGDREGAHSSQRKEKITEALKNCEDYLVAINELLPHARHSYISYGRTNALLLNATLLLEQTIFSLMAYLDIPSAMNPHLHALFELIQQGSQSRPRFYSHQVDELLTVVQSYINESFGMRQINLTQEEIEAIKDVNHFIGGASRYLHSAKGKLAEIFQDLQHLSALHFALETDWLQKSEEDELTLRFQKKERSEWKKDVEQAIFEIQSKMIYPKVNHLLRAVEKLMQYSSDLRFGIPNAPRQSGEESEEKKI